MFDKLKSFFRKKSLTEAPSEADLDRAYEAKKAGLEAILGPLHNMVGHAIIPFFLGGTLDMYYFPKGIPGTGFASMELIGPDGTGPKRGKIGTYELVSFTKHSIASVSNLNDKKDPFFAVQQRLGAIMTAIARYSTEAVLNPGETCEIPLSDDKPNACIVLDAYHANQPGLMISGRKHGLLLCIDIFPQELSHARKHGSASLLEWLKTMGHYPYSDLDRSPVM